MPGFYVVFNVILLSVITDDVILIFMPNKGMRRHKWTFLIFMTLLNSLIIFLGGYCRLLDIFLVDNNVSWKYWLIFFLPTFIILFSYASQTFLWCANQRKSFPLPILSVRLVAGSFAGAAACFYIVMIIWRNVPSKFLSGMNIEFCLPVYGKLAQS